MTSSSLFQGAPGFTPATRWPALAAALVSLAIVAAAFVVAGVGLSACLARSGASPADTADLTQLAIPVDCQLASLAAQQAAFVVLTLVAAGFYAASRWEALALKASPNGWTYAKALLLMLAGVAAYTAIVSLINPDDIGADLKPFLPIIRFDPLWAPLLLIGVGAPLSEELLFRGFLLPALARSRLGFVGAALLTTVGWTALHFTYSIFGLLQVFLIGLFFCWLVWRTGSVWVPMFCHAAYNSAVLLALRYAPLPV